MTASKQATQTFVRSTPEPTIGRPSSSMLGCLKSVQTSNIRYNSSTWDVNKENSTLKKSFGVKSSCDSG